MDSFACFQVFLLSFSFHSLLAFPIFIPFICFIIIIIIIIILFYLFIFFLLSLQLNIYSVYPKILKKIDHRYQLDFFFRFFFPSFLLLTLQTKKKNNVYPKKKKENVLWLPITETLRFQAFSIFISIPLSIYFSFPS